MSAHVNLRCLPDGLSVNGLDIEGNVDLITDDHAAGLENLIPIQTEVFAVDRGLGEDLRRLAA
jgi:hypothetical protein